MLLDGVPLSELDVLHLRRQVGLVASRRSWLADQVVCTGLGPGRRILTPSRALQPRLQCTA
jgi:hypothetical protein